MREPQHRRWSEVYNPGGGVPPLAAYKNPDNGLPTLALPPPPDAPTGLAVATFGSAAILLTWTAVAGATGYEMDLSTDDGATWTPALRRPVLVADAEYPAGGLAANTGYTCRVRAYNAGGTSGWSDPASGYTDVAPVPTDPGDPPAPATTLWADDFEGGDLAAWDDLAGATLDPAAADAGAGGVALATSGGSYLSRPLVAALPGAVGLRARLRLHGAGDAWGDGQLLWSLGGALAGAEGPDVLSLVLRADGQARLTIAERYGRGHVRGDWFPLGIAFGSGDFATLRLAYWTRDGDGEDGHAGAACYVGAARAGVVVDDTTAADGDPVCDAVARATFSAADALDIDNALAADGLPGLP